MRYRVPVALALVIAVSAALLLPINVFAYAYSSSVLALSPSLYWPIDESGGSSIAAAAGPSLSCYSGMLGAKSFVSGDTGGIAGGYSPDYAQCASSTASVSGMVNGRTSYSTAFWGTFDSSLTVGHYFEFAWSDRVYKAFQTSSHTFAWAYPGNNVDCGPLSGDHMVVLTVSGAAGKCYVDNVLVATGGGGTSLGATLCDWGLGGRAEFNCGGGDNEALRSTQALGQFAFFPSVLSTSDINSMWAARGGSLPGAQFLCSPGNKLLAEQASYTLTCTTTDPLGDDVTSTDTYVIKAVPFPHIQCDLSTSYPVNMTGHTTSCKGLIDGTWVIIIHSNLLNRDWIGVVTVVGTTNRLSVNASPSAVVVGQQTTVSIFAFDATPTDITAQDSWSIQNADSTRTCVAGDAGTRGLTQVCSWNAAGTKTITIKDQYGFSATTTVGVTAAPVASVACGSTDLGCYLTQLWNSISALPFHIIQGVYELFFVSSSGINYLDLSPLVSNVWPNVACRSGQTPTAPDGIHCFAFPFSIPTDIGGVFSLLAVSPSAPTISFGWDFPLWTGVTLHESGTVDPTVLLTTATMTYVRDAELLLFIIGTAMGTWRILQLVGVG